MAAMSSIPAYGAVDLGALAAAREAQAQAEQRAAARAADPTAPAVVIDVTDATFQADVLEQSMAVPVVIDLWATWCGPCKQLSPILERLADEYAGRWILARVDVDANPGIAQAFQVQSIPSVFAVVGGRPLPLFQGALPEQQVRAFLDELLQVAASTGISGTVGGADAPSPRPPSRPATLGWKRPTTRSRPGTGRPHGLPTSRCSTRTLPTRWPRRGWPWWESSSGSTAPTTRAFLAAADAAPDDLSAQELAADVLVLDGRPIEAFARLLGGIRFTAGPDRDRLRMHLLDLFEVVGPDDPAVARARIDLANALF